MRMGLSKRRLKIKSLVIAVALGLCFYFTAVRLQPTFVLVAREYANNTVVEIVNRNVAEVFENYNTSSFYIQDSGTFINNVSAINTLKSEIINSLNKSLTENDNITVKIPLGSASGFYLLNGMGPNIPVKILPYRTISADFEDIFEEAGINFVKHTLYLNIAVEVNYRGFVMNEHETVTTRIPVVENIMSGSVPNYYGGNIGVLEN